MKLINTRVLRDLRTIRAHIASIVLAMAVAMSVPAGLEMGLRSLMRTRDSFTTQLNLADLDVRMLPEDVRNLPDWSDIPGIERVESRLLMPGTLELADGRTITALTVFLQSNEPRVNQLRLLEGKAFAFGANDQAVVERSASTFAGVRVGDILRVTMGKKIYRHDVTGIASSPEFLIVAANPEYFLPEKGSLAVIFTSLDRVFDSLGFSMVNNLIFKYAPDANPESVKASILRRLEGRSLERVITGDEHLSRKHIEVDDELFRIFQPAISAVLAIMAFALVLLNINRLIRAQYKEIGAVLGLGYSAAQVVISYSFSVLWLCAAGIAVGSIASLGFRDAFMAIYSGAHAPAYMEFHVYGDVLARNALTVVLAGLLGTAIATRGLWRATPRSLMRPMVTNTFETSRIFRLLSRPLSRTPLTMRLAIRNLARRPRLAATTVVAVALSLGVAVAYIVCLESMGVAILRSFSDQRWDRALSFLHPCLDEDYQRIAGIAGVTAVEPFVRTQGQIRGRDRTLDSSILGIAAYDSARRVSLTAGRMVSGPSEIVIGEDFARRLSAGVGAELVLRLRNQDINVSVVGTKSDVLLGESIVELAWLQHLLELEDQATGVFVTASADSSEGVPSNLDERLQELDFIGRSTLKVNLIKEFENVMQDIRKLVMLVASIALIVAVLFVAANMSMTMNERTAEFGTLRALGYDGGVIARVVVVEVLFQVLFALAIMAPSSYVLAEYLNRLATEAWFHQPTVYPLTAFLIVAIGVLVFAPASLIMPLRALVHTDVTQALRARAIE